MTRGDDQRAGWLRSCLSEPVDIASQVAFRIAFGGILLWENCWFLLENQYLQGWIEPPFHFTYLGFEWIAPWPGTWIYVHIAVLGLLAVAIAVGWHYRIVSSLFFVGFTYLFLLEQARYLNHFYLVCLVSLLMIFIPAHHAFSLDVQSGRLARRRVVRAWTVWILRAQIAVVYFFGGVAKLNGDWLRAEPMRPWLADRTDMPILGRLFEFESSAWLFSYSGLLIDLLIVPLLLWKRTRIAAFLVALLFHLLNAWLFDIGIFPWFMIAATTLFLAPDWPRRCFRRFASLRAIDASIGIKSTLRPIGRTATTVLVVWLTLQCLIPLRHFLYPGVVHWTEEGHRFAWRMKLRHKDAEAWFHVKDPATGSSRTVFADSVLQPWQLRNMKTHPDMILQFAHYLAARELEAGRPGVEVRASAMATLHGRPLQLLIDPSVDLAAQPRSIRHMPWIVPLRHDLPTRGKD